MPTELPNDVRDCSQHGVVTARAISERPGRVIPVSKTFCWEYILFVPLNVIY